MNRAPTLRSIPRLARVPVRELSWRGTNEDGTLSFAVTRTPHGLHVERLRTHPDGVRAGQSALFVEAEAFKRWCDGDDMRFISPHLCSAVRLRGLELFQVTPLDGDGQARFQFI